MKMLVTAGPTREFLDPVRFLSNRSTGKMGYAVAAAGRENGHEVHLITGPVALPPPEGVCVTRVVSAAEMLQAVLGTLGECDVLVMCAAVADWRPRCQSSQKLKKHVMDGRLELERTEDILSAVRIHRHSGQIIAGFAAETEHVIAHADEKRVAKGLDLIVANDVTRKDAGFESDANAVTFISEDGIVTLPLMSKDAVAGRIVEWLWLAYQKAHLHEAS